MGYFSNKLWRDPVNICIRRLRGKNGSDEQLPCIVMMQRANYVWIHLREVAENGLNTIGSDRIVSLCLAPTSLELQAGRRLAISYPSVVCRRARFLSFGVACLFPLVAWWSGVRLRVVRFWQVGVELYLWPWVPRRNASRCRVCQWCGST